MSGATPVAKDVALGGLTPEALNKVIQVLTGTDGASMTPLSLYVWIKRAEDMLSRVRDNLRPSANEEYAKLAEANPGQSKLAVEGFAVLTKNSLPGNWIYSPELVAMEQQVKAKQEQEKANGQATKKTPPLDPKTHVLFKVACTKV